MEQAAGGRVHWQRRDRVPVDGPAVKAARVAKGWSREKLAAELGCSHKTVERYETGARLPERATAARLVELLGMGVEVLGMVAAGPNANTRA